MLLLLQALAVFAAWLTGMAAEAFDAQDKLNSYSTLTKVVLSDPAPTRTAGAKMTYASREGHA